MSAVVEELSFQQQAVLWGQAYEVLVKRGVLACLLEKGLIQRDHPQLKAWAGFRLLEIRKRLVHELGILDENGVRVIDAAVEHLALTAYGVGYPCLRGRLQQRLAAGLNDFVPLWVLYKVAVNKCH